MKKIDLVHTAILIVAILAGYSAIEYLFYVMANLVYSISPYFSFERMFYDLLMVILFSIACAVLVKNGRKYAGLILKDEPEGSWDEAARLQLDRRNLLLVLFIGLGLYTLIQYLPYVLNDLFQLYRDKVSSGLDKQSDSKKAPLVIEMMRVTIGAFLIYAAPALTDFIIKKIAVRPDSES
jgi:hypothetical protein